MFREAHTPCCEGGVCDFLRGRASDRPHRLRWWRSSSTTTAASPSSVTINLGTKNFGEEYILGQLYGQALQAKGFHVVYKGSFGSSELADKAITSGKMNFYPEYTGVVALDLAKVKNRAEVRQPDLRRREEVREHAWSDVAQPDAVRGHRHLHGAHVDREEGRPHDDERPEQAEVVLVRGLSGVRDADHLHPRDEADLRAEEHPVHPDREHQRLHAARPGQGDRGRRLLHRPGAAPDEQVHGAGRQQAHLRLPERRTGVSRRH